MITLEGIFIECSLLKEDDRRFIRALADALSSCDPSNGNLSDHLAPVYQRVVLELADKLINKDITPKGVV